MPNLDPRLPAVLNLSPRTGCLLMAVLAFLLGICLTLLLYHLRQRRALDAREDDSHEL